MPPAMPPAPDAAMIRPHVPAPPRSRSATSGPTTVQQPSSRFPYENQATNDQSHVRERKACQPFLRSAKTEPRAAAGTAAGSVPGPPPRRIRLRRAALPAKGAAAIASAHPAPAVTTRRPAMLGPATRPTDDARLRRAFACWRLSASTTVGRKPVAVGLKKAVAAPDTAESSAMTAMLGLPAISAAAI